jgi:hypothetical protein
MPPSDSPSCRHSRRHFLAQSGLSSSGLIAAGRSWGAEEPPVAPEKPLPGVPLPAPDYLDGVSLRRPSIIPKPW